MLLKRIVAVASIAIACIKTLSLIEKLECV